MITLRDSFALLSVLVTRRASFCTPAPAEQVLTNALPFQYEMAVTFAVNPEGETNPAGDPYAETPAQVAS
jgi:hypothetical protein